MFRFFRIPVMLTLVAMVLGCSAIKPAPSTLSQTGAGLVTGTPLTLAFAHWVDLEFPAKKKTQYHPITDKGVEVLQARADGSASMYRWHLPRAVYGVQRIEFSWKVTQAIPDANIANRHQDDSPARLVLAFEGDRSKFSPTDSALSELTHLLTGEPMPFATLMYVWCDTCQVDRVVPHSRTSRIRYIALAPATSAHEWQHFSRDVTADFVMAFGEPLGPLSSVGLMTDADNTQSQASALFGAVTLHGR